MPRQIQELDAEGRWASQRIFAAAAPPVEESGRVLGSSFPVTVRRRPGAGAPGSDPAPFHREPSAG